MKEMCSWLANLYLFSKLLLVIKKKRLLVKEIDLIWFSDSPAVPFIDEDEY